MSQLPELPREVSRLIKARKAKMLKPSSHRNVFALLLANGRWAKMLLGEMIWQPSSPGTESAEALPKTAEDEDFETLSVLPRA